MVKQTERCLFFYTGRKRGDHRALEYAIMLSRQILAPLQYGKGGNLCLTGFSAQQHAFMEAALREADKAALLGEVPVGAVIVFHDKIIARGHNLRESRRSALAHAELIAIEKACKKLGGWRLWQCELYVTLEPCPMCAGAIMNARIPRVYIGAPDPKAGAMGSVFDLFSYPVNHKPAVCFGVLGWQCGERLCSFFAELRSSGKKRGKPQANRDPNIDSAP
jgi:tRNA(adenine34) deaminase